MVAGKKASERGDTRSIGQGKSKYESSWQEEKGGCRTSNNTVMHMLLMLLTRLKADADSDPSDQKRTKTNFPSGLVSNWESKMSLLSQTSKATASESNDGNTMTPGGLNDEDALAIFSPASLITRAAPNRKNDVSF